MNLKTFFISGWTGLIGSEIVNELISLGHQVYLIETKNRAKNRSVAGAEYIEIESHPDRNKNYLPENSFFIHLAANGNIQYCSENPKEAIESNVMLTIDVLNFCKTHNINNFIFASTGILYSDLFEKPCTEGNPVFNNNIYGSTKLMSEQLIHNFSKKNNINSLVLRLGNVFGKKNNTRTVISDVLEQIENKTTKIELLNLSPRRDFIYVKDVCQAIFKIADQGINKKFDIVNLSNGESKSVLELATIICKIKNYTNPICEINDSSSMFSNITLDISKIKKEYNWQPKYTLESALKEILLK
ncbi:MAG: NAD(P)-dependent oxidoreductase [Bacteroidetes bacterium]|nr:NAD(P)-dependent oxidoreductase [Bacteroidota bacterium]